MFVRGNELIAFQSPPAANNFIYDENNLNSSTISPFPPHPNWQISRIVWSIHIYGFSFLFLGQSVFSVFVGIRFRQRILRLNSAFCVCGLISVLGVLRAIYLCDDPNGVNDIVSPVVTGVVGQVIYPLLCACYGTIQIMLLTITRLNVKQSNLRTRIIVSTLIYICGIIVIEMIVYYDNKTRFLVMLDNGAFIVFGLYLCISFISNGVWLSQYADETKCARKQLDKENSNRKTHSNFQLSRSSSDRDEITLFTDAESTSSADNDNNRENAPKRKRRHKKSQRNRKSTVSTTGSDSELFDSLVLTSDKLHPSDSSDTSHKETMATRQYKGWYHTVDTEDISCTAALTEHVTVSNNLAENNDDNGGGHYSPAVNIETFPEENGYLADNEITTHSPKMGKHNYTLEAQEDERVNRDDIYDDAVHQTQTPIISLYRIRQESMIQRSIKLTYCLTFLFLCTILLQLYTVFGVYGVLNRHLKPDPWPWFIFQTLFRSTELAICVVMMAVVHQVLNHRHRTKKPKHVTTVEP